MELDQKVLTYVKNGMASGQLSRKEGNEIATILKEYKQLVKDGHIPGKLPQDAFKDVLDLHEHKKKKLAKEQKQEETIPARVHHLIDKIAPKYGIKEKSEELQEVHDMADGLFDEMPDLDGKPPELFVESLFDITVGAIHDKRDSILGPKPDKKPRKPKNPYAEYKFSEATLQKKQAKLERLAQKRALREEYMALQSKAAKRAFNFEHGRYNVGRKAARTNRAWDSWNEDRKNAYLDRKLNDINTIDFDRQQRELIIRTKELPGLVIGKLLGKNLGRQNQLHGTGRKVKKMHQLQSLLIRKRELWTNWVNSTIQGQSLTGLK